MAGQEGSIQGLLTRRDIGGEGLKGPDPKGVVYLR